ncbi:MAG: NTP transferase domain-containing protein [Saprospiraceae bacterium]|nr:NTP transferase domain-containing protein [Lewinellaceae bacterium]
MRKAEVPPVLKALVLAGGRSTRMGHDKGLIQWHGKPQREYLVDLLEELGVDTYISCRQDQVSGLSGYKLIVDQISDQGPLGAIYSAFCEHPDAAWLVVACDMPLLDIPTLEFLINNRQPALPATAFRAPAFSDDSPDPLLAIWEPRMRNIVVQRIHEKKRCARKTLGIAGFFLLEPPNPEVLANVNTPEELASATG